MTVPAHTHVEREDEPWAVEIQDHPGRTESEGFRRSKATAHKILAAVREQDPDGMLAFLAGPAAGRPQSHHGGSLWLHDGTGWMLFLSVCGIEWSAQFSADPRRVDELRKSAARLYLRFPETMAEFEDLGYPEAQTLLAEPIADAEGVARWTDSVFNACVMASPGLHSGVVSAAHPDAGGIHHFPQPIWSQQLTKRDDFRLWVTGGDSGLVAAVTPIAPPGSGDGRVEVVFAQAGSELHRQQQEAHAAGRPHILDADHPLAVQAFQAQAETSA